MATRSSKDKEKDEPAEKPELLWVRSKLEPAKDGGHPVALFESDVNHPGGQAYVAGPKPVQVASTSAVVAAIRGDQIEELEAADAKKAISEYEADRKIARTQALKEQAETAETEGK